jgi:hypothetical protein
MLVQECVHLSAQILVLATGVMHIGVALVLVFFLDGGKKDLFDATERGIHDTTSVGASRKVSAFRLLFVSTSG